jgi:drug/metabolite transporter (DMT)-like permease
MDWLIFSIIASIFWGLGVVIDKYLLTKHMQDPFSYQLLYMITEVPILLLLLFTPISQDFPWFALGIVGGLGTYLGLMLYFKAMAIEEASRVISLIYISPIFVLILASVFLQETLSLPMYFGVIFLVLGAISVSYRKVKGRSSITSPALGLLLASSVVWAGYEVLTKYVLGFIEYPSYLFWNFIGTLLIGFLLFCFPKIRCNFLNDIKKVGRTILFWRILNTSMGLIAIIFYYIAISRGFVSLVAAISSMEPFFVFIFTLLLSLFVPRILKEDIGKGAITTKALAIILIIVGTGLIAS